MPTVIDSLIVTLDLDPKGFTEGQKKAAETVLKMKGAAVDNRKAWEENNKRVAESFKGVTNQVIGLGLAIVGASSIIDFAKQTIALDASVGRLAHNFNVSTEALSTWQGAVREVGGSTQEANQAIQALVGANQQYQVTGTSPIIGYLQLLGMTMKDLQNPMQALLTLNEKFSKMNPATAQYIGAGLGLSPNVVNLLEQDPAKFRQYLDAAAKAYQIHQADADAAQKEQQEISLLSGAYQRLGNTLLTEAAPGLIKVADGLKSVAIWMNKHPDVALLLVAAAAAAAARSFFLMAAGMTAAAARFAPILAILAVADELTGAGGQAAGTDVLSKVLADPSKASDADLKAAIGAAQANLNNAPAQYKASAAAELDKLAKAGLQRWGGSGAGAASAGAAVGGGGGSGNLGLGSTVASLLAAHGVSADVARGIGAAVVAEGGSEHARDQYDKNGHFAYGIFQARGKLQRDLFAKYGSNPTTAQQVEWFLSEKGKGVGVDQVLAAGSANAALIAMIRSFLQPGLGTAGDLRRGGQALPRITITIVDKVGVKVTTSSNSAIAAQANRGLS